jgi:tetratricopeptide (TPR) repeat protein
LSFNKKGRVTPMPAMANCPYCGKLTDPNLGNCVHCGGYLQRGRSAPAQRRTPAAASQTCPACGALVQPGDIICVACGTSILTGQRIIEGKKVGETRAPVNWRLVGIIALVILIVAAVFLAVYAYMRDPVKEASRLAQQGQLSQASQILREFVQNNPENARAQFEYGLVLWQLNQLNEAANAFEAAADSDPANAKARYYGALTLAAQGTSATRAREIALLEGLVRLEPDNQDAKYMLAMARGANKDFQGQLRELESLSPNTANAAELAQAKAAAHALLGEIVEANRELSQALASTDASASGNLHATAGLVASLEGKSAKSAIELQQAVSAGTAAESVALLQLGLQQIAAGDFVSANDTLQRAEARDPTNDEVKFFRAVCLYGQNQEAEAISQFEALYRSSGPFASASSVQLAQIYLQRGDPDRAKSTLDRALGLGEASAAMFTLNGRIQASLGADNEAQDLFKQAIQIDPKYGPAHLENGLLYVKRGVLGEGVRELERYVELVDPNAPDARVVEIRALIDQLKKAGNLEGSSTQQASVVTQVVETNL